MKKIKLKAQSWSMDLALALVIFLIAFLVFYFLINENPSAKANTLKEEASTVVKQLSADDSTFKVVTDKDVNISRLVELKNNYTYSELKRYLRIEGDFCIYFEDDKGFIVLINDTYRAIGAPSISLGGIPCSQK